MGLVDGETGEFFPVFDKNRRDLTFFKKKFDCVNPEQYQIYGDFSSSKAKKLRVRFVMCQGEGCKAKADILEYVRNKYMIVLYN